MFLVLIRLYVENFSFGPDDDDDDDDQLEEEFDTEQCSDAR